MTSSAFFMNRTIYILNLIIRASIVIAGLLIEFNVMNLSQAQWESVQWIGKAMIVFGILRLAWFFYQTKQLPSTENENHNES